MVYTLASGASGGNPVEVRVLFPAPRRRTSSLVERRPEEASVPSPILGFGTIKINITILQG